MVAFSSKLILKLCVTHLLLILNGYVLINLVLKEVASNHHTSPSSEVHSFNTHPLLPFSHEVDTKNSKVPPPFKSVNSLHTAAEEKQYYFGQKSIVNPFIFDVTMVPPNLCSDHPFLVVFVMSRADFVLTRQAIRNTWGSVTKGGAWPGENVGTGNEPENAQST